MEKKKQLQLLHDDEMASIIEKNEPVRKVTRFQLEEMENETNEAADIQPKPRAWKEIPLNTNRMFYDVNEARTIDDAINLLK